MVNVGGQEDMETVKERQRILVVGHNSPLMEGVSDLLQVAGYPVQVSTTWMETEYALYENPPDLVIVDLSAATPEVYSLADHIRNASRWGDIPILYVSFSGDDRIRELQWHTQQNGDKRLHFYAHTLLSMDGLLDKVRTCLVGSS